MAGEQGKNDPGITSVLSPEGRTVAQKLRIQELRVVNPGGQEQTHTIRQPVVRVGSHPGNDVVLSDDAVSRIHFEIAAEADGFRLRDLGSTNGTFVDGLRLIDGYLRPRSRIVAGLTQIHFALLEEEAELPVSRTDRFGPLVGRSPAMLELFATLERVASSDFTVLIQGDSGTGKELIAAAIHGASPRSGGPFVVFDCAAVPENLIESELFGHEKGAFTGAQGRRVGCMEEADGGTLFLDELGELPLDLQPKLLRALERKEVKPLGSNRSKRVDVRFVAATHRDLAREVNRGGFREDLYYRIAVIRLRVPPLRERIEDIPLLVEHIVRDTLKHDPDRASAMLQGITPENWRRLAKYPWRGNVRELRNVVERSIAMSGREPPRSIEPLSYVSSVSAPRGLSLPSDAPADSSDGSSPGELRVDLDRGFLEQKRALLERFESTYLLKMLEKHEGNISRAAAAAGIDRMYFKRLLKRYQI